MRFLRMLIAMGALALGAFANPITWTLSGVTFADGSTASGSFVFDADTNTYSSIDITTSTTDLGGTYGFDCVSPCNGLPSDASEVLFLQHESSSDLSNTPGLVIFFATALTDAGGTDAIHGFEGVCSDKTCSAANAPFVDISSGNVVSTPESSAFIFLAGSWLGVVGLGKIWRHRRP